MLYSNSKRQTQLDSPSLLTDSLPPVLLLCFLAFPSGLWQRALADHGVRAVDPYDTRHGPSVDDDLTPEASTFPVSFVGGRSTIRGMIR